MPVVNIPNVGSVTFPDTMSHEDITKAIENDILKLNKQEIKTVEQDKPEGFQEAAERSFVGNALKISGGLGNIFGFGGADKDTYAKALERQKDMKEGEHWYSPENLGAVAGSAGVQLPAMAAAVPAVMASAPAALGGLGTAAVTGLVGSSITAPGEYWGAQTEAELGGATPEQAQNMGRNAAAWTVAGNMLPGQGGLLGRFVKGAAQNVGATVGEAYSHNLLADGNKKLEHDPWNTNQLILSGIAGGTLGAATGSRKGERWMSKNEKAPTNTPTVRPEELYKEAQTVIAKEIAGKEKQIESIYQIFESGTVKQEMVDELGNLEADVGRLKEQQQNISDIVSGTKTRDRTDIIADSEHVEFNPDAAPAKRAKQLAPDEDMPILPEPFPRKPYVEPDDPYAGMFGTLPKEETPTTATIPKQDPFTIADSRITEAGTDVRKITKNLDEVNAKLEAIAEKQATEGRPGTEYSGLREALLYEKEAYEAGLKEKQAVDPELQRLSDEANTPPITGDDRMALIEEARAKSQQQLEQPTGSEGLPPDPMNVHPDNKYVATPIKKESFSDDPYILSPSTAPFVEKMKALGNALTPNQLVAVARSQLQALEKMLTDVNAKINSNSDFGTTNFVGLEKFRQKIEDSMDHWEALRAEGESGRVPDDVFAKAEPKTVVKPTKVDSTVELLGMEDAQILRAFSENPQLFETTQGTKIHFDKAFGEDLASFKETVNYLLNKLGWLTGKDQQQLYFVVNPNMTKGRPGQHNIVGNTGIIYLNPADLKGHVNKAPADLMAKFTEKFKTEKTRGNYFDRLQLLRVATHEIGHHLLYKIIYDNAMTTKTIKTLGDTDFFQTKLLANFAKWYETRNKDPLYGKGRTDSGYYRDNFAEFFAEEVKRGLTYKHLGAEKFLRPILEPLRKLLTASREYFTRFGLDMKEHSSFVTDFVDDIIARNKEHSKILFDEAQLAQNDKALTGNGNPTLGQRLYQGATLEAVAMDLAALNQRPEGMGLDSQGKPISIFAESGTTQGSGPGQGPTNLSMGWGTKLMTKMFANVQLAQIFRDNPYIAEAYLQIRNGQKAGTQAAKKIWHGVETIDGIDSKSIFTRFSNVKDKLSPYFVVRGMKNLESYNILQVAKKAFDEDITHADAMVKYKDMLSDSEMKSYETLAKMWDQQFEAALKLEQGLGKKDQVQYRNGWYPSARTGQYQVNLSMQGHVFRSQTFLTKAGADAFRAKVTALKAKEVDVSETIDTKLDTPVDKNQDAEAIKNLLKAKYPRSHKGINEDIDKMLETRNERGGKLGQHHEKRTNMVGYKGTELFGTPEELGNSFKQAIISSVDQYSNQMQNLYVRTKLNGILTSETVDPNTKGVIQQMSDNVMGKNKNVMESFDSFTAEAIERVTKRVMNSLGKEYKGDMLLGQKFLDNSMEWLYLAKIMSKMSFVLGQGLAPFQSLQHMAYDTGMIRPWVSMGKGMMDLVTGNAELKQAIILSKNDSHTFEPQFIEALELTHPGSSTTEFIKDWGFTRRPSEIGDTWSRVITFAAMYNHYKDQGKDITTARELAKQGTDATMVSYGSGDSAAMFSHAGGVGRLVKPLQTYPTAALGNLVANVRHMAKNKTQLKAYAPFLTYALTTVMIGGIVSLQFVQEYEAIRKMLEDNDLPAPPSTADVMGLDANFDERVDTSDEKLMRGLLLGLPAELAGIDVASSLRTNETMLAVLAAIISGNKAWHEAMPTVTFPAEVVGGAASLARHGLSNVTGGTGMANADLGKAIGKVAPSGPIGYGLRELAGTNTTKVFGEDTGMLQAGKDGQASKERTGLDIASGYMGTKSTEDRANLLVGMRKLEIDKRRQNQIKVAANKFAETGHDSYITKLIELGVQDKEIASAVSNQVYKKIIAAKQRYYMTRQGKINVNKAMTADSYGDLE